jgi:RimJ/RimL family protein N-acetyltransferase
MILPQTDRLLFRKHERRDEAAFVEMHTDPQVRRYAGDRAWSPDEAASRFRTQFLGKPTRTYGLWAAILRAEDVYVGMCGLRGTRVKAHLGCYIARPYWGVGLATEAARAFVDLGLHELRLKRIAASVDKGNGASERVLQKLGFEAYRDETLPSGRVIRYYQLHRV